MNNTQFITMIIGFVALLLSLWGGAWLNQRGLERQMESFRAEMKAELGRVTEKVDRIERQLEKQMESFRAEMKAELGRVTEKVDRIERQLEQIFKPILPK